MSSEDAPHNSGPRKQNLGDLIHTTFKPCASNQQTDYVRKTLWMEEHDTQGELLLMYIETINRRLGHHT